MEGKFQAGFDSWRRILASGADTNARAVLFCNMAAEVAKYVSFGLDAGEAADALTEVARAHGLDGYFGTDELEAIISGAFDNATVVPDVAANGHDKAPAPQVVATPYVLPNPAEIPPRAWLAFKHYMRGVVTSTVAPGGYGKTSIALYEVLEMVKQGITVWYISAEDDRVELDRRIAAYVQRHALTAEQLHERLYVDDKLSFPFKIARSDRRSGVTFDEDKLAAFEAEVVRRRIDVVFLDPFISFHYLPENDTAAMDALIKRLGDICTRCGCCIELTHHVRKPGFAQTEITVHDARGAAAIVNAVRSCRVVNTMTKEEAEQAEVMTDKRMFYLRIDSGKSNMAPAEKARWLHLASETIANGDFVGAIEPWVFPAAFGRVTPADVDWVKDLVARRPYRADNRSPDWLGHELAARFGRDVEIPGHCMWINQVLTTWVKNNVIGKGKLPDEKRKLRIFYVPYVARSADVLPFPGPFVEPPEAPEHEDTSETDAPEGVT